MVAKINGCCMVWADFRNGRSTMKTDDKKTDKIDLATIGGLLDDYRTARETFIKSLVSLGESLKVFAQFYELEEVSFASARFFVTEDDDWVLSVRSGGTEYSFHSSKHLLDESDENGIKTVFNRCQMWWGHSSSVE